MWFGNSKKRHFKKRIQAVQEAIWDHEFNKAKLKMLREQMRKEYDRVREMSLNATNGLEAEKAKETPDEGIIKNFTTIIERYDPDIQYLTKQMESIDQAIDSEALDQKGNPIGTAQKIEAGRTMLEMLKEYVRGL